RRSMASIEQYGALTAIISSVERYKTKNSLGLARPSWGRPRPSWGSTLPHLGKPSPYLGKALPFIGRSSPFFGRARPSWGAGRTSLGGRRPFGEGAVPASDRLRCGGSLGAFRVGPRCSPPSAAARTDPRRRQGIVAGEPTESRKYFAHRLERFSPG